VPAAVLLLVAAGLETGAVFGAEVRRGAAIDHIGELLAIQIVLAVAFLLAAAACVARGPQLTMAGAAFSAGVVAADVGLVISAYPQNTAAGTGLRLATYALLPAALGAAAAWLAARRSVVVAAVAERSETDRMLAVLTFLVAWDRNRVFSSADGRYLIDVEQGSVWARHTPSSLVAGSVLAAVVFFVVPTMVMAGRRSRMGLFAAGGVVVAAAAQALSGYVGLSSPGVADFATAAQIKTLGLSETNSLTPWWDAEVLAVVALLVLLVARWQLPRGPETATWPGSDLPGGDPGTPSPWVAPYGTTADRTAVYGAAPHGAAPPGASGDPAPGRYPGGGGAPPGDWPS
jgi:hypothetical protein